MKFQEIENILTNSRLAVNFKPLKWGYRFFFQKQFPFFKITKVIDKVEIIDCSLLMEAILDYYDRKIFGYITKIEWIKNKTIKNQGGHHAIRQ